MNWVLALLAFAGLMAILSTIVSAVVEAVHKLFALRSRGLQEMLRAMHDSLDIDENTSRRNARSAIRERGHTKDAARFATDMTMAPSWGGRMRWWWPARWGVTVFPRRFERLTKRQLAEQLAQTDVGASLADRPRHEISSALARAGYEFDRYGVAQSHFFRRRAKLISGAVAFIFVIFANVNAIELYLHLAQDEQSLDKTMAYLGVDDAAALAARAEAAEQRLTTALDDLSLIGAGDGETALSPAELNAARLEVRSMLTQLKGDSGLPMGHSFFPFCGAPDLDERCKPAGAIEVTLADGTTFTETADVARLTFRGDPVPFSRPLARLKNNPGETFIWLMSMIATAGLLALGAPFWFDLFNKTASLVGSAAGNRLRLAQLKAEEEAKKPDPMPHGKRGDEEPDIEAQTDAFLMAAGRTPSAMAGSGPAPAGGRIGLASDVVIATAPDAPAQPRPAPAQSPAARSGVRQVRGDWSGDR